MFAVHPKKKNTNPNRVGFCYSPNIEPVHCTYANTYGAPDHFANALHIRSVSNRLLFDTALQTLVDSTIFSRKTLRDIGLAHTRPIMRGIFAFLFALFVSCADANSSATKAFSVHRKKVAERRKKCIRGKIKMTAGPMAAHRLNQKFNENDAAASGDVSPVAFSSSMRISRKHCVLIKIIVHQTLNEIE